MASQEELNFNAPHKPAQNALDAFSKVYEQIKFEIIKSRHHWDKHEPKMWSRATEVTDAQLTDFTIENDLVLVRSAATTYGTIILGKIRIPAIENGYIHVRIHDPPGHTAEDVKFHSLFTDEGNRNEAGQATTWDAIQTQDTPLEFFNE